MDNVERARKVLSLALLLKEQNKLLPDNYLAIRRVDTLIDDIISQLSFWIDANKE